ncbi:MAG: D-alanyl-D-alanine carboxypeptidase, partial [Firmicutes bacterium]|nr:D-alanyl-D-alanine carboxypeptidase [Bacillota bacterium]
MIKRVIIFLLLLILFINPSALKAEEGQLELTAEAAVLMDRDSRRVLYAQNPHQKRPMASTTKIMTAVTALEAGDLDDVVIVSERAAAIGGSSIWLSAGEEKTLEELLYGLMLRSGNDAAVAIAEHIAGSIEAFAVMMTKKAREIGALNSSFKNPHGLHDEKHYITAYDLSLIASYALRNPKFREIIATRDIAISWPGAEWDRLLHNQNRLLDLYPGGDGVKTGWTTPAGRCFVGSATRDGWQLVATVLNAPDMYNDAIMLLDYGFNNFTNKRLIAQGQFLRRVEVEKGVQGSVR